jgi:hypothetical protein
VKRSTIALVAVMLVGFALRFYFATMPGYPSDIKWWSVMARRDALVGLPHVYDPYVFDPNIGVYPPVYHVMLNVVGLPYRWLFSPTFVLGTPTLKFMLKLLPILWEGVLALVIYVCGRRFSGERNALLAAGAYFLNPSILYTVAYWGMFGDSFYALCIVLTLFAYQREKPLWAGVAIAVGVLFKPQTAAFLPLILWWAVYPFSAFKWRRALLVGAGIALTTALVFLPFLLAKTLPNAVSALRNTVGLFPVLSANAHNSWWLISGGHGWQSDLKPVIGSLDARTAGLIAFGGAYLLALFRRRDGFEGFFSAAYVGFAFFMLSTEMHENYLYPVVALLMIVWRASPFHAGLALTITVTSLANMALHDIVNNPAAVLPADTLNTLRLINSAINAAAFTVWTLAFLVEYGRRMSAALRSRTAVSDPTHSPAA